MPVAPKPVIHGRDHAPGGADPIPGFGGGGATGMGMTFSGPYPVTTGIHSAVGIVPSLNPSYPLSIIRLQVEPYSFGGPTVVRIEANGVLVHTITLATGDDEQIDTTSLGTLNAGDSVRLNWTTIATATAYVVHLESD